MSRFLKAMFIFALVASAGVCVFFGREGVETDLLALMGRQGSVVEALFEKSSSQIRVLCPDEKTVQYMRGAFGHFDAPVDPTNILALVRMHGKGLLSEKHRAQLMAGETNKISRSAMRRDYSGIGLFPKADDPYYFLNDFVMDFRTFAPNLPEGAELLTADVRGHEDEIAAIAFAARKCGTPALSGAPFHSSSAEQATKSQIAVLGGVSLFAVLMIGWWLFGSCRFVLPMALVLGSGYLVASAAVLLLPGRPHALTFLFGTTLIGLGVDYCYHGLSRRKDGMSHFARNLTAALVTTCFAFSPLFFSAVAVLNQMAVFTVAGLVAIYAFVLLFPWQIKRKSGNAFGDDGPTAFWLTDTGRGAFLAKTAFAVAVVAGCLKVTFGNDPASFYEMSGRLAEDEARVAEALGYSDARLALVDCADFEGWQRENAALKAKMGVEPAGEFLSVSDLPRQMTLTFKGRDYLVLPAPMAKVLAPGLARVVDTRAELQSMFDSLAAETIRLVAFAFVTMALALFALFRRRFLVFVSPVACALAATVGALGWIGEPVNFFQLLCFFILAGLGIDYSIFHKGELSARLGKVVFASFLTSLVGLGMLSFTSFQVTHSMGVTLGIGLVFSYLFSLTTSKDVDRLLADDACTACAPRTEKPMAQNWLDQPQRAAGPLRMRAIFITYRIFGKSFTKFIAIFIILCVYPWARPVRAALRKFAKILDEASDDRQLPASGEKPKAVSPFKIMLNFAWAMVDKMDTCCFRTSLPKITVKGDEGWMKCGCFLLSTHVGCIDVLAAMRGQTPWKAYQRHVHAFQQLGRDAIYTSVFVRHLDKSIMTLHAVEEIGVETAVEMQEAIKRGEIVLMAGDRLPAGASRTAALKHEFLGRECSFPKGVFRFAKLMECPVYAITCVRTDWNAYEVEAKKIGNGERGTGKGDDVLLGGYVQFLESAARRHPDQWYQFYDFFA